MADQASQAPAAPIKVALVTDSIVEAGGEGTLRWKLVNQLNEAITDFQLTLESSNRRIVFEGGHVGFSVPAGAGFDASISVNLTDTRLNHIVFRPRVEARTASGFALTMELLKELELRNLPRAGEEPSFTFISNGHAHLDKVDLSSYRNVHVRMEQLSAMTNVRLPAGGRVTVETSGGIAGNSDLNQFSAGPTSLTMKQHDPDALVEISGFLLTVVPPALGLSPLSLDQFVSAWPHGRSVQAGFVDADGRPRQGHARVNDIYRLHVRPDRSGFLTLITQGTSRNYYLMAPTANGNAQLEPHRDYYWPGALFAGDADDWAFLEAGEERILALLTDVPLIPSVPHGIITPDAVASLLGRARLQPDSVIGYGVIQINNSNSWRSS